MSGTSQGSTEGEPFDYVGASVRRETFQVGGDHYTRMPIQPFDIIEANHLDFWQGNILKYVMRFRSKGGVEDLRKAQHYLERLIDIEERKRPQSEG